MAACFFRRGRITPTIRIHIKSLSRVETIVVQTGGPGQHGPSPIRHDTISTGRARHGLPSGLGRA
jgi:hypothetical protein